MRSLTASDVARKAAEKENERMDDKWVTSDDSEYREMRGLINKFLESLEVDNSIFKSKRKYVMTEELATLFTYILNEKDYISDRIIKKNFDKISSDEFNMVRSHIIAAIYTAPCSDEEKEKAKQRLDYFFARNSIDTSIIKRNNMVDFILDVTWEAIRQYKWVPNSVKYDHAFLDDDWKKIREMVYKVLYERNVLELYEEPALGMPFEKSRLVSNEDVPFLSAFSIREAFDSNSKSC